MVTATVSLLAVAYRDMHEARATYERKVRRVSLKDDFRPRVQKTIPLLYSIAYRNTPPPAVTYVLEVTAFYNIFLVG